ncbi:enoyl-CoA hydratase/isomerase family protein [Aeromicrobium sp. S22]|nr:enoyl-CoA hydratase/isomerase family protein [Aeromicrobium sp. S22]
MTVTSSLQCTWHPQDVLELRLHRPERRNALDQTLIDALRDALDTDARRARCTVLTGADTFFCSGGDVASMPGAGDGLFGPAGRLELIHGVIERFAALPCPTVVAVEGYALGAGWGLALAGDILVAGEDAAFQAPFSQRGLAADAGVAWHLTRRLGRHGANRHLLLGEPLTALEALSAGLVTILAAPRTATRVALDVAARLAAGPVESVAVTRWMSRVAEDRDVTGFLREERIGVALAGHGRDAAEGKAAFREKREPEFAR